MPLSASSMSAPVPASRFIFIALYVAAVVVLLDQVAELVASLYPFRIEQIQWRFGAFGLIVGRTTTAVIVDALVFLAALGLGHRGVLRAWGGLHFVLAALLIGGLAVFTLDALELRRTVAREAADTFVLAAGRAAVVVAAAVVYCIWAAIAAFRTANWGGPRASPTDQVLVVKRPVR